MKNKLIIEFENVIEKEFTFLKDMGYKQQITKKGSSKLLGDSYTIDFINKNVDRTVSISMDDGYNDYSNVFILVTLYKNLLNENGTVDDYMSFEMFCKSKKISLEKIKKIREKNSKTLENLNLLIKEFAVILKSNFQKILEGKEWINGLHPEWR